ncbi:hypothetical protein AB395_00004175 [Sinorhizobium fredii CCBAU 45436]|nr:hypothetical protein AB395_00004175 [Sinorhizobium fredii CCBAU 45436]
MPRPSEVPSPPCGERVRVRGLTRGKAPKRKRRRRSSILTEALRL